MRENNLKERNQNLKSTATMERYFAPSASIDEAIVREPFVKPSETKSLQITEVDSSKKAKKENKSVEKVTSKNLLMVVGYCVAVVALVVAIAVNATALGSLSSKNAGLNQEIDTLNQQYTQVQTELNAISDPVRLSQLASDKLSLSETSAKVVPLSLPQINSPQPQTFNNNWFDKFCDGISGIFGVK